MTVVGTEGEAEGLVPVSMGRRAWAVIRLLSCSFQSLQEAHNSTVGSGAW